MYVFVQTSPGKKISLLKKIRTIKDVVSVEPVIGENELLVKLEPFFEKNTQKIKQIKTKFYKLKKFGLSDVGLLQIQENEKNFADNNRFIKHYFFDIDSTLTSGPPGFVHHEVREIFQNMRDLEVMIYFSTGRSMDDVVRLMNNYPVMQQAIVENGSILIGYGKHNYDELGDRKNPVLFVKFLKDNNYAPKVDTSQMGRITEMVLQKKPSLSLKKIEKARQIAKKQKGIDISILGSQNSFHITQRGINKGSALNELANRLKLGSYDEIISVGDSELDIPMFKESHRGYLMGNATTGARKLKPENTVQLRGSYIEGIQQIYRDMAKF